MCIRDSLYTQLFNLLCDKADDEHGGRLPYHVRLLLDEFANIGQIPKFDKLIATIRCLLYTSRKCRDGRCPFPDAGASYVQTGYL